MKKILYIAFTLLAIVAATPGSDAKPFKRKSKKEVVVKENAPKPKTSKYDKTFRKNKSAVTAKCDGGFMAVHKANGKVYLELPVSSLGKEMLIASTITGSSSPEIASVGYKPTAPLHVRFELSDSTIFMNEVNLHPDFDEQNKAMARAMAVSNTDPVISTFKLFCYSNDSTSVVFDASSVFTGNYSKLAPVKSGSSNGINTTVTYNSSGGAIGDIKAFKDNVTIKAKLSYNVTADMLKLVLLKKDQPLTIDVTRTILLLPEKKMRPRVADSRVGVFLTERLDMNNISDQVSRYAVLKRWDIQPSDTAAWQRGELVEPVKGITFYLDDAFPEQWREPARLGALRWNKAFEAIGFKNVIKVLDFPHDDPEFDPDNLKYSCIRYIPAMVSNAMGPSWCDPTTGEIINASVIVYNDLIKLVNGWRFVQTAQVDPSVRGRKLPDHIVRESIEYAIAHEVGHTLGFMHNMSASAAYSVESLRDPEFTKEFGTTASIMDYARFNYVAQPEDKDVKLTPPFLGPYDYWLVKYTYQPVIGAKTIWEDEAEVEKWVTEKAGDPIYRYGRQQTIYRYDPSAIEEDLGDDPIKASDYGIKNLKYILAHFNEWMGPEVDPDATLRAARYELLAKQFDRYIANVMLNIGGVKLTAVKPGTPGRTAEPLDKKTQQASLKWVLNQLRHCEWIADKSVTDQFTMRLDIPSMYAYYDALDLFEKSHSVILSSNLAASPAEAYTISDWCDDIYSSIFEQTIRHGKPSKADITLQNLYTQFLLTAVNKKTALVKVSSALTGAVSLSDMIRSGLDETGMLEQNYDFLMNQEGISDILRESFGAPGYGWQGKVNLRTVDNSKEVYYGQVLRIQSLLKGAIPAASGDTKVHYQALLHEIETSLKAK